MCFSNFSSPLLLKYAPLVQSRCTFRHSLFNEVVLEKCTLKSFIIKSMRTSYILLVRLNIYNSNNKNTRDIVSTKGGNSYPSYDSLPVHALPTQRQHSSQILKHLCDFLLPQCWFGYYSRLSAPKYAWLNIGEGEEHIWVRTKVSVVNVRNLEKIQDKWLLFQRFVTSIVVSPCKNTENRKRDWFRPVKTL